MSLSLMRSGSLADGAKCSEVLTIDILSLLIISHHDNIMIQYYLAFSSGSAKIG